MYDAAGYYSGGIYDGNDIRSGNPDLCRHLNQEFNDYFTEANNLFYYNQSIVPFALRLVNAKYKAIVDNVLQKPIYEILQTVCVPKSCTYYDLKQVMSYAYLPLIRSNIFIQNVELTHLRILDGDYRFYEDFSFYIVW